MAAVVVALAATCFALPASAVPMLGQLDTSIAWSPGHPPAGVNVTFTATASDNDGTVRFAQICYGDSTCSSPDYPAKTSQDYQIGCIFGDNYTHQWTHAFPRAGTFMVTLTVTTRGCPGFDDETKPLSLSMRVG